MAKGTISLKRAIEKLGQEIGDEYDTHGNEGKVDRTIYLNELSTEEKVGKALREFLNANSYSRVAKFRVTRQGDDYTWRIQWPSPVR